MKITRALRDSCPNGIDCDRILDTDGADVVVQGRLVTDPHQLAALGLREPPAGEGYVLLTRSLLPELDAGRATNRASW